MVAATRKLARDNPDIKIKLATSSQFALNALHYGTDEQGEMMDAETYSRHMMNAKICLVPRGTSPETFRFFEALRYGCIPIAERLPDRWFYDEAPAVFIDDWNELGNVIRQLLSNEDLLEEKHRAALDWWKTRCSETVLGTFMAERLDALRRAEAILSPISSQRQS